jgi:hypothetical protein
MKKLGIFGLLGIYIFMSVQSLAQNPLEQQKLLCKTWKIKKVIIDNRKVRQKVINDHISFRPDMKYFSYDSKDVNLVSSVKGLWKLSSNGTNIITDPNTDKETFMKIIKLKEDIFVYELTFKQATWQVYLKPE